MSKLKTMEWQQTQVGRQGIVEEYIWNVYNNNGVVFRINEEPLQINKKTIMQQENGQMI